MCKTANSLWLLLCKRENKRFFKEARSVQKSQEKILFSILEKNSRSQYGEKYNFSSIGSVKEFQEAVPVSDYEDYVPYIDKISHGESNILTTEEITMFELSSGSTSASKYIPYTKSLKEEFRNGIKAWIYNLYTNHKKLSWGSSYWSITPVSNTNKETPGGVPIGFEEDSEYFGFIEQFLLNKLFSAPAELKHIEDMNAFKYTTVLFMLKQRHLTLISVWNPTFLTLLLEPFDRWKDTLVQDLENGTISPPEGTIDPAVLKKLTKKLGKNTKRARELKELLAQKALFTDIWPNLALISCWTSGNTKAYIPRINELFPGITIQGKGLLATEAFVSFPVAGYEGSVLSARSHFFEFIEQDKEPQTIKTAWELEKEKTYSVLLTTGGGFYRYRLHDLIRVLDFIDGCPVIDFIGKEEKVSDYFGEKVNEYHISNILEVLFPGCGIEPDFFMVAPSRDTAGTMNYVLYLELKNPENSTEQLAELEEKFEKELQANFHYKYCRELEQLKQSRLFLIDHPRGNETYIRVCASLGQRIGDIKPSILHTGTGWSKEFPGRLL
ncbi:MAG: GH3 auxin-responsive promoter family protein [bacterium]|nr:GH3 auxin-responsive promoter family protein [bacterium]